MLYTNSGWLRARIQFALVFFFLLISSATFAQITASFTYSIDPDGKVTFTNTSTGDYDATSWRFDQEGMSYETNPVFYFAPGTYPVLLSVGKTGVEGSGRIAWQVITVGAGISKCTAKFTITQDPVNSGLFHFEPFTSYTSSEAQFTWKFACTDVVTSKSASRLIAGNNITQVDQFVQLTVNSADGCNKTFYDTVELTGSQPTGIEETRSQDALALTAYPVPFTGSLLLDFNNPTGQPSAIRITDITGKECLRTSEPGPKGHNQVSLDTHALPSGIYIIEVQNGDHIMYRQVRK